MIKNNIKNSPNIIANLRNLSASFLFIIPSYINSMICPPSNIGTGKRLTIPIPVEIIAIKVKKDIKPDLTESETA